MDVTILYWHWLAFGMVLIMFEMALPSFTALWFGVGAVLVGLLLWLMPTLSISWQVFIWTISSATATLLWFRYFKPRAVDRTLAGLSREAILGEVGHVIVTPNNGKRGKLRFSIPILGADEWDIICEQDIALGDRVAVVDVSGNTLVVKKQ
jgi:membrane protein implicated in regulation of membrane protease activity